MKVEYLFSRSKGIASNLIRWASSHQDLKNIEKENIPSHVAVLLNDTFVIESVFGKGVRLIPYSQWKKKNIELYKIPCTHEYRSSAEIFSHLFEVWGKPYDWLGILYFSYRFIRKIYFKKELGNVNKWERSTHFFCIEFAARLSGSDYSMTTPAKLCDDWLQDVKNG